MNLFHFHHLFIDMCINKIDIKSYIVKFF